MTKPIINVADAPVYRSQHGELFEFAAAGYWDGEHGRGVAKVLAQATTAE